MVKKNAKARRQANRKQKQKQQGILTGVSAIQYCYLHNPHDQNLTITDNPASHIVSETVIKILIQKKTTKNHLLGPAILSHVLRQYYRIDTAILTGWRINQIDNIRGYTPHCWCSILGFDKDIFIDIDSGIIQAGMPDQMTVTVTQDPDQLTDAIDINDSFGFDIQEKKELQDEIDCLAQDPESWIQNYPDQKLIRRIIQQTVKMATNVH